jgi:hypothetical protein
MKRKPTSVTPWLVSVDPEGDTYTIRNLEKNASYAVGYQKSNFTCKAFVNYGYCKLLLFVLKKSTQSSATIDLFNVCTFVPGMPCAKCQFGINRI